MCGTSLPALVGDASRRQQLCLEDPRPSTTCPHAVTGHGGWQGCRTRSPWRALYRLILVYWGKLTPSPPMGSRHSRPQPVLQQRPLPGQSPSEEQKLSQRPTGIRLGGGHSPSLPVGTGRGSRQVGLQHGQWGTSRYRALAGSGTGVAAQHLGSCQQVRDRGTRRCPKGSRPAGCGLCSSGDRGAAQGVPQDVPARKPGTSSALPPRRPRGERDCGGSGTELRAQSGPGLT